MRPHLVHFAPAEYEINKQGEERLALRSPDDDRKKLKHLPLLWFAVARESVHRAQE